MAFRNYFHHEFMNPHYPKLAKFFFATLILFSTSLHSQTNQWTWLSGPNLTNQPGVYGTRGIPSAANYPGTRVFPATWTDNSGNFWLFGGNGLAANSNGYLNDLWKYDPLTKQWTWINGSNQANQTSVYETIGTPSATAGPGGRDRPVGWTDKNGNFWLFGGNGPEIQGTGLHNDLWKYNPQTNKWTWVTGSNLTNTPGIYGIQGTPSTTNTPGARWISFRWTDKEGNFWLWGGTGFSSFNQGYLSDLWKFNPENNQWTWMKGPQAINSLGIYGIMGVPSPSNFPSGRSGGVSWTDSTGNLWVFGGDGYAEDFTAPFGYTNGFLNDLWKYNINDNTWTWIKGAHANNQPGSYGTIGVPADNNTPGARNGSVSWTDIKGNLWLFSGNSTIPSQISIEYNDVWKFNSATSQWTWMNGSNLPNAARVYGTKGTPSPSNTPGARTGAGSWTDRNGNFLLFGGVIGAYPGVLLADLWKLNPQNIFISIISPLNNAVIPAGTAITLEAKTESPDNTITKVEFYNGPNKFSEDLSAPYSLTSSEAEPGNYVLTAKAYDNNGSTVVSDTVRITVTSCPPPSGTILAEGYTNINGSTVANLTSDPSYPNSPSITAQLNAFEYSNAGVQYGGRLRGYICAPLTGDYIFYISGDDQAGLFLSTDDNPANKVLVAFTESWTGFRQWNKFATQKSVNIRLIKGARYYMETLHKQYLDGNHLSVAWRLPNGVFEGPMPGSRLSPWQLPVPPGNKSANNFNMLMTGVNTLTVTATPNPSRADFTISSISGSAQPMTLTVTDVQGRMIEQRRNVNPNSTIQIGNQLRPGLYMIEIVQGAERKILKLIKQ
jgi:N-acetylneuraminic acid mutarotase